MEKYYNLLNCNKFSSKSEIRKNYLKLCLKYHPDKNKSENATEMMKQINDAYNAIIPYARDESNNTSSLKKNEISKLREFIKTPYKYNYILCEICIDNLVLEVKKKLNFDKIKVTKIPTCLILLKRIGEFLTFLKENGFSDLENKLIDICQYIYDISINPIYLTLDDFNDEGFYINYEENNENQEIYSDINEYILPTLNNIVDDRCKFFIEKVKKFKPTYDINDIKCMNYINILGKKENLNILRNSDEEIKEVLEKYKISINDEEFKNSKEKISKILFNYKGLKVIT